MLVYIQYYKLSEDLKFRIDECTTLHILSSFRLQITALKVFNLRKYFPHQVAIYVNQGLRKLIWIFGNC